MATALVLLLAQGLLGALDTLIYHEWKARLAARMPATRVELRLHAARDGIYGCLFLSLPWVHWNGALAWVLGALLATEIAITLADFVVEDRARAPQGGVAPGERVMHTVMAIVYGAFLAHLLPVLMAQAALPIGFASHAACPSWARPAFLALGCGVWLSGLRDLLATWGIGCRLLPVDRELGSQAHQQTQR